MCGGSEPEEPAPYVFGPSMAAGRSSPMPTPTPAPVPRITHLVGDPGGTTTSGIPKEEDPSKTILKLLERDGEEEEKKDVTKYTDKIF